MSSYVASFSSTQVRSTTDTSVVGTLSHAATGIIFEIAHGHCFIQEICHLKDGKMGGEHAQSPHQWSHYFLQRHCVITCSWKRNGGESPEGHARQFSVESRENLPDRFGSTRGRWYDISAGSAASAPVLLGRPIHCLLGGRRRMHRCHQALQDTVSL
jgi:hypothetical protein